MGKSRESGDNLVQGSLALWDLSHGLSERSPQCAKKEKEEEEKKEEKVGLSLDAKQRKK